MNNDYIARDVLIGAGIEGYRAYQATGDPNIAAKAAVSGGATILGGFLIGCIAIFLWISGGCCFLVGDPGPGFLFILGALLPTWIVVAILRAHTRRMNRYMAPQPVPAPPGLNSASSHVNSLVPRSGQQYTYDVTTGQYHKHW